VDLIRARSRDDVRWNCGKGAGSQVERTAVPPDFDRWWLPVLRWTAPIGDQEPGRGFPEIAAELDPMPTQLAG
jgi:hypothetical protein